MGYGTISREQELENALRRLVDLYDEGVLVLNHPTLIGSLDETQVEEALEAAAIAIELDEDDADDADVEF